MAEVEISSKQVTFNEPVAAVSAEPEPDANNNDVVTAPLLSADPAMQALQADLMARMRGEASSASAPSKPSVKRARAKSPGSESDAEATVAASLAAEIRRQKLETQARGLKLEKEALERKKREEQNKAFARAAKAAGDVKAREIEPDADTPERRADTITKINRMRDELQLIGTGRACTLSTPLATLVSELEVLNQQANMRRARDMPVAMLLSAMRSVEPFVEPFYSVTGAADDVALLIEQCRENRVTDETSRYFDDAITHWSIMHAEWFEMSPTMYVALTLARVIKERHDKNEAMAEVAKQQDLGAEVAAEFEARRRGAGSGVVLEP